MTMVIVFVTPIAAQTVLPNIQGLKLQNVTGYVILLVRETYLGRGFNWTGIIYITGSVTLNRSGGEGINVRGQIHTGTSTLAEITINGDTTLAYNKLHS